MEELTKMGRGKGKLASSHGKYGREKSRCSVKGCKKLAKDFNPSLCRIHSPIRKGYIGEGVKK
jgi:hypothetical protein